jgi:hypothetical protein
MNRDDIIRMAQEAFGAEHELFWMNNADKQVELFATLVAAAEREECAKVCDALNKDWNSLLVESCAATIRSGMKA